ncbi:MAG: hypothetical protein WDM92_15910 [Caulobacteraceae bacterium]
MRTGISTTARRGAGAVGPLARGAARPRQGPGAEARPAGGAELPRLFLGEPRREGEGRPDPDREGRAGRAERGRLCRFPWAWAYYRLGDYAKAVQYLESASALDAGDAEINDHLGDALLAGGPARRGPDSSGARC